MRRLRGILMRSRSPRVRCGDRGDAVGRGGAQASALRSRMPMTGCGACRSAPSPAPATAVYRYPARIVGGQVVQGRKRSQLPDFAGEVVPSGAIARDGEQRRSERDRLRPAARHDRAAAAGAGERHEVLRHLERARAANQFNSAQRDGDSLSRSCARHVGVPPRADVARRADNCRPSH